MRPRFHRTLPGTLVVCLAPLLAATSATASIINFNEQRSTNNFALPSGTNLLASATPTPAAPSTATDVHEGSSTSWAVLTNGSLGTATVPADSVTPGNNATLTYALDVSALTGQPGGYSISSFDSYCAWANNGRDNQNYTLQFSTVGAPTTFTTLATVSNQTQYNGPNTFLATHTRLYDTTGVMATGVHSVRIIFGATQENNYTGFREFFLKASPTPMVTANESNNTNVWTLPAGINLLSGLTANTPTAPSNNHNGEITSSSWNTLTDVSVGNASDITQSVACSDGTSVIFPLDTNVNFKGYNLTSLDTYCSWPNSGRDNQNFVVRYSTVTDPTNFIYLGTVANQTTNVPGADNATHTRLSAASSAVIASGVAALKFEFAGQENGYVGYREFIALGSAVPLVDLLTWTGAASATWNTTDGNWKKTSDNTVAPYNVLAPLTFDSTGGNRSISVPVAITASSMTFANNATLPSYAFTGEKITVSNNILSTGDGVAIFNSEVKATTGISLSGAGSLVFAAPLESPGMTLSGSGSISLTAQNDFLTGNVSVSAGTLNVGNDLGMFKAALVMTGGTANFTTAGPALYDLSGTAGSLVLGNPVGPVSSVFAVGAGTINSSFKGGISEALGTIGYLTKVGTGSLSLGGDNTYTGSTEVQNGTLEFSKRLSLYHGLTGSWTASNIIVRSNRTLVFGVGAVDQFSDADLASVDLGGFEADAILGLNASAPFTFTRNVAASIAFVKKGVSTLTLTGSSSYTGTSVINGTLILSNPTGPALLGNILLGDKSTDVSMIMGASNQFGPNTSVKMDNGTSVAISRFQLRGTSQTLAGLDSPIGTSHSIVENDEVGTPGYTTAPALATLTLDVPADTSHLYSGTIQDQSGQLKLVKTGLGTQEIRGGGYHHTGGTFVDQGVLKLNVPFWDNTANTPDTVAAGATLVLDGSFNHWTPIVGEGTVVREGSGNIVLVNNRGNAATSRYSGGTIIKGGTLTFYGDAGSGGAGTGPNQYSAAGLMDPSNVITVKNGGTMKFGQYMAIGRNTLTPQYANSVKVEEGGLLSGTDSQSIAFIANVTLDGGAIEIGEGKGYYNTNIALVGTLVVGGVSTVPANIYSSFVGPYANISLGSASVQGVTFEVADVTTSSAPDLVISALLKDLDGYVCPLVKTGPGTMSLVGAKAYTGATNVNEGTLSLDTTYLADSAPVSIAATGTLELTHSGADTVDSLYLEGTLVVPGTYGALDNPTPGIIQTARITGTGLLSVTHGLITDPYVAWSSIIPDLNDRDLSDDPDGDGFTNLQEYLFGTSPVGNNGSLTAIESAPGTLIIRWNQRASGTYTLQESTTLTGWTTSLVVPTEATDQSGKYSEDYTRMEAIIPVSGEKKFVRVLGSN